MGDDGGKPDEGEGGKAGKAGEVGEAGVVLLQQTESAGLASYIRGLGGRGWRGGWVAGERRYNTILT